jgi:hypothetical protein
MIASKRASIFNLLFDQNLRVFLHFSFFSQIVHFVSDNIVFFFMVKYVNVSVIRYCYCTATNLRYICSHSYEILFYALITKIIKCSRLLVFDAFGLIFALVVFFLILILLQVYNNILSHFRFPKTNSSLPLHPYSSSRKQAASPVHLIGLTRIKTA